METETNSIVFIIVASLLVTALLLFVVIDSFLGYKNKKLKHKNEILSLNSKFENEILVIKNEVTEQIFSDISSELHENICQILSLAVIQINQTETKNGSIDQFTANSRESIRQAITDIRSLSHTLNGDYWKNFDIYVYLKQLKDRIVLTQSITTNFDVSPEINFNSKNHELILIRILQELINNSIKHGKASEINLSLIKENDFVKLVYNDNGVGMNGEKATDGMGMLSIKQRLTLLKAKCEIKSEPNKGFHFSSTISLIS